MVYVHYSESAHYSVKFGFVYTVATSSCQGRELRFHLREKVVPVLQRLIDTTVRPTRKSVSRDYEDVKTVHKNSFKSFAGFCKNDYNPPLI